MKYRKGDFISPSSICKERHWYSDAMQRMSPPPWIVEYQNSDIVTFRWNRKDGTLGTSNWSEGNLQLDECENE